MFRPQQLFKSLGKSAVIRALAFCAVTALAAAAAHAEELEPVSGFDPDNYRGQVLYLDFWASWCAPCRASFPWMNEMQRKYASRGLRVVAVSVDTKQSDAEKFLQRYPAQFQLFLDTEGKLAEQYELPGMPSSFLFARDGALVKRHLGFRSKDKAALEALIVKSLDKREPPKAGKAGKR